MEDNQVKFVHFSLAEGGATVAYCVEDDMFYYGIAFCSPKDQYNKKKGRLIASGRLSRVISGPIKPARFAGMRTLPLSKRVSAAGFYQAAMDVMDERTYRTQDAPSWAQQQYVGPRGD